ncbi:hypothetical protein DFJ74DRAFT_685796 [Hyaloraphidium curvatum]|nr:hypothetical protein DFJ74DRAFT_685796 [Hyaloraphidium curvatum]
MPARVDAPARQDPARRLQPVLRRVRRGRLLRVQPPRRPRQRPPRLRDPRLCALPLQTLRWPRLRLLHRRRLRQHPRHSLRRRLGQQPHRRRGHVRHLHEQDLQQRQPHLHHDLPGHGHGDYQHHAQHVPQRLRHGGRHRVPRPDADHAHGHHSDLQLSADVLDRQHGRVLGGAAVVGDRDLLHG